MTTTFAKPIVTLNVIVGNQCSNGGVSSRYDSLDLYPTEIDAAQIDPKLLDRAVRLVVRNIGGKVLHVEPVLGVRNNQVGYMAGGSYVAISDSRLSDEIARIGGGRFYGALALHDRTESVEQYRALSI